MPILIPNLTSLPTRQDYKNSQIKRSIMGKPERTPRGIICKQRKGEGHRLEATKRKFKQFKLNCFRSASDVTSEVRFVTISVSDWHKIEQIWDLLRSVLMTFGTWEIKTDLKDSEVCSISG